MTSRMRYYDILPTKSIQVASYGAATTIGTPVDTKGWESLTFIADVGLWTTPETLDLKLQECDTLGGTYTDVAATDFKSNFVQVNSASNDRTSYMIAYTGAKRFVQPVGTTVGGGTIVYGVVALQSWPRETAGAVV